MNASSSDLKPKFQRFIHRFGGRPLLLSLAIPFAMAPALHASEGVWMPHKLQEGITFWNERDKVDNLEAFMKRSEPLYRKVVRIGACSGGLVGKQGLILTQYHCARSLIHWHSTPQKDLALSGFLAKNPAEELKSDDGISVVVTHQLSDVSSDITKDLAGLDVDTQLALVDQRIKSRVAACEKKTSHSCRVEEVSPGTQYVELEEEVLTDLRLVFVPTEADAYGTQSPFHLQWGAELAPFAFMRLYKDGKPYEVKNPISFNPKPQLTMGLPIMTVGYTDIYKRYLTVAYIHSLFENGMMKPMADALHKMIPFLADRMKDDKKAAFEYRQLYQSLSEWMGRLDREPQTYAEMKIKTRKVDRERDYINHQLRSNPKALEEFEAYNANTRQYLFYLRHDNRFDSLFLSNSMKLVAAVLKNLEAKTPIRREWLERKKAGLALDVEQHFLLAGSQVFAGFPYPSYGQGKNIETILNASEPELKRFLNDTLSNSFVFRPSPPGKANLDAQDLKIASDPLISLYKDLKAYQEAGYSENTLKKASRRLDFAYFPKLEQYHREKNLPFYPNIGKHLSGYALGKIRAALPDQGASRWNNFNTDIDACFRDLKGAPVFDIKGNLLGMYVSLGYRGLHDVNFYHDPERTDAINLSSQRIHETLVRQGARALLKEIEDSRTSGVL